MVKKRLEYLGIKDVYLSAHEKIDILKSYVKDKKIDLNEVLYMGDDIPDHTCIKEAGVGACPHDAAIEIRDAADYISHKDGGKGCVRDVLEQTMRLHGKWFDKEGLKW